jgi:hypothetical protein
VASDGESAPAGLGGSFEKKLLRPTEKRPKKRAVMGASGICRKSLKVTPKASSIAVVGEFVTRQRDAPPLSGLSRDVHC